MPDKNERLTVAEKAAQWQRAKHRAADWIGGKTLHIQVLPVKASRAWYRVFAVDVVGFPIKDVTGLVADVTRSRWRDMPHVGYAGMQANSAQTIAEEYAIAMGEEGMCHPYASL
jgi:hypothetical protein